MRVVTIQLSAPARSAATWTREESARITSEWLLMRSGLRGAVLVIGTTGTEIEIEPELITFFAAEGGAVVVVGAPVRNPLQLAHAGLRVFLDSRQGGGDVRVVAAPIRNQVPLVLGTEVVVPDQALTLAELEQAPGLGHRAQ